MKRLSAVSAVLLGGAVAGTLDIVYAIVFWHFRGVPAARILQSVASGLLGKAAYEGGWPTAALGLFFQYVIATSAAAVFYVAAAKARVLASHPVLFGVLFGLAVYGFMNYVVLPLSAFPGRAPTRPSAVVSGVLVHMFFIGLPIALFAARSLTPKTED